MQTIEQNQASEKSTIKAKVRAIGNSLGIILPKKILANAGIKKGDEIIIEINVADLLEAKRIQRILSARGSLKRLYGEHEQWDYDTDDFEESDKSEYGVDKE